MTVSGKPDKDAPCTVALKTMEDSRKYASQPESAKTWDKTLSDVKKPTKLNKTAPQQAEKCCCEGAAKIIEGAISKAKKGCKADKWKNTNRKAKQAENEVKDAIKLLESCNESVPSTVEVMLLY